MIEKKLRAQPIISNMNSVGSLMQRIFPLNKMKYLSDTYTISRCNNRSFIKFKFVFPPHFLRPYKERIFALL